MQVIPVAMISAPHDIIDPLVATANPSAVTVSAHRVAMETPPCRMQSALSEKRATGVPWHFTVGEAVMIAPPWL